MDSNFRQNPLTGHWVIIAGDRGQRPNDFGVDSYTRIRNRCPFCVGNETDTPETIVAYDSYGHPVESGEWLVRVFPNKYPAVHDPGNGEIPISRSPTLADCPYRSARGGGVHELIVESPRHVDGFGQLDGLEQKLSVCVYQDRLKRLRDRAGIDYAMLFKNCRPAAGATIEHTHCQLIGTPIVPNSIRLQVERGRRYFGEHNIPLGSAIVAWEIRETARIVETTAHFVAFCPYASHLPYEVWIYPLDPNLSFWDGDSDWRDDLAMLMFRTIGRLENQLDRPPYNFGIHLAPFDSSSQPHYQWHVEIAPRLTKMAGFEWGTGCMINPVAPETAALRLRQATFD